MVNIDVARLDPAIEFYTRAFDLRLARRLGTGVAELVGMGVPLYLLEKPAGERPTPAVAAPRDYRRHWTPVHLDFTVDDLERAVARALAAGAVPEREIEDQVWGRIAYFADPFGNGFCIVEFKPGGYDNLLTDDRT